MYGLIYEMNFYYICDFLFFSELINSQTCIPDIKWVLEQGYTQKALQTSNSLRSFDNISECMKYCRLYSSDEIIHYSYSTKQCLCLTIS